MNDRAKTRVLLVDDHTLVRAGIRKLLEALSTVEVVGEAGSGREGLAAVRELSPDVVVMDIGMPDINGLEATALMRAEKADVKVLILSMHRADEYVMEAMRVGACGYLLKESATAELGVALEAAARGEKYLSPAVSGAVVRSAIGPDEAAAGAAASTGLVTNASEASARLTPRQRDILRRIAEGNSTKEIAYDLGFSSNTVETHRAQLMDRLGIHDVAGLVRFAIRIGLVSADR
ncbi:MAG: response regulator [Alphaproteobacteria bacterium]